MRTLKIDQRTRVLGILWTAVCLFVAGCGVWAIADGFSETRDGWQKTPCVIDYFQISPAPEGSGLYVPDLRFRYEFGGQNYAVHSLRDRETGNSGYDYLLKTRRSFLGSTEGLQPKSGGTASQCLVDPDRPERACLVRNHDTTQIFWGLALILAGGPLAVMGLGLAHTRESRRRAPGPHNKGDATSAKWLILLLPFLIAGVGLLGLQGAGVMPTVWKAIETGTRHRRRYTPAEGIVLALCLLAIGACLFWRSSRESRKQRQRSLKAAQDVAEARERRLRAKGKGKRKRS